MRLTSRSQYIDIVQHGYFGGMARAQPEQRLACTFLLEITPRSSVATAGYAQVTELQFFQFEAGLITAVTAYFAIPPVDINPWRG